MRVKHLSLAAVSGLTLAVSAAPAFAGSSCSASDSRCNPGTVYSQSAVQYAPVGVHYGQPYDHLRRAEFVQSPQINVTRIETGAPLASLSDALTHGWPGCSSAGQPVCTSPAPRPLPQPMPQPRPMPMPMPAPAPVMCGTAPRVVCATPQAPVQRMVGQGYDASKFVSRTYGDTSFHTGDAYLPTSRVHRSPAARDAVLSSMGMSTVGSATLSSNVVSSSSYSTTSSYVSAAPSVSSMSVMSAPTSSVTGSVMADGSYWEKASGPTMVDGLYASEILCKKQAPVVQKQVQVVRPVIAVRTPYPVYVPPRTVTVPAPMPQGCAMPPMARPMPMMKAKAMPKMGGNSRYGSSHWTY